MYLTVEVKEEEVKTKLNQLVKDILQKDVTLKWIKEVVSDEIRKEANSLIKSLREAKK